MKWNQGGSTRTFTSLYYWQISFVFLPLTLEPPEVRGLRAVFIDDTSIRISWDQINIPGIVYEIDLSPRPPQMEKLITTDLNECNLDNLITLETYIITLSSIYGNHRSSSISIQVVPGLDNSSTNTIGKNTICCHGNLKISKIFTTLFVSISSSVHMESLRNSAQNTPLCSKSRYNI